MLELLGTLLNKIAESGVVGVFCAVFMIIAGYLGRALLKAKDQAIEDQRLRINDYKEYAKTMAEGNEATQTLVVEIKEWTSGLMVKHIKEFSAIKTAMDNQAREFDEMEEQHRRTNRKYSQMKEEFKNLTAIISGKDKN